MQDIKQRELKMQEKRKNTPWREFVKEIGSRVGIGFHRNNGLISKYPPTNRIKISSIKEYDSMRDDLIKSGLGIDGKKSFFEQFNKLFLSIPLGAVTHFGNSENAQYSDCCTDSKNIYMNIVSSFECENILYSIGVKISCKNVLNSCFVWDNCDNIFSSMGIIKGYNIFYSKGIINSSNIWFSTNLIGCSECVFCSDLQNQKYCIKNKKLSEQEYFEEKKNILKGKDKFKDYNKIVLDYENLYISSNNSTGNILYYCENINNGIMNYGLKNSNNVVMMGGGENPVPNIYDSIIGGASPSQDYFGSAFVSKSENIYCSENITGGHSIYYSYHCESCSYCLGCIGLKNKSFCILNKQYTKEERFRMADDIFQRMSDDGTLGKFFPASMNPFYFNDTVPYLIDDSFTKDEVTKEGYLRRDEKIKVDIPLNADIIKVKKDENVKNVEKVLSDYQGFDSQGNRTINPEILKKVIQDSDGNYYTIQKMELEFLQKYGLPLPEIHWLDRIKLGFKFK